MRRAWMPQLQHARRCLNAALANCERKREFSVLTIDEGVQDRHGTVGDTSVRVDLLEDCDRKIS